MTSGKIALFIALSVFAYTRPLRAQTTSGFLETQTRLNATPGKNLIFDGGISRPLTKRIGVSGFFLTTGGWAEAYAGPTFQVTPNFSTGLSIGGEQSGGTFRVRYAGMVWVGMGKLSALHFVEANNTTFHGNDSGLWYDLNTRYQVTPWLMVGLKDRRSNGFGPIVQTSFGPMNTWVAWLPANLETGTFTSSMVLGGVVLGL